MSNILISVYSLVKSNNGFFKSDKQAAFLISQLDASKGMFIESFSFGEFNGAKALRTVFVSWDSQGITEIKTVADVSRKESVKFTRISAAEFTAKQEQKQVEKEQSRLQSIADYQRLITEQQAIIDSKTAANAAMIEQVKQNPLASAELIESFTTTLAKSLEVETKDNVKLIEFYTEAMKAYL